MASDSPLHPTGHSGDRREAKLWKVNYQTQRRTFSASFKGGVSGKRTWPGITTGFRQRKVLHWASGPKLSPFYVNDVGGGVPGAITIYC